MSAPGPGMGPILPSQPFDADEARRRANIFEEILSLLDTDDEFVAVLIHNQLVQINELRQTRAAVQTQIPEPVEVAFDEPFNAGEDIFDDELQPEGRASLFRTTVSVDTGQLFRVTYSFENTTRSLVLNQGNNIAADQLFTFDIPVDGDFTINYRGGAGGEVNILLVQELKAAGP